MAAVRRPLHRIAHPECPNGANWSDCDKVRDEVYAEWQAMQQVILAYNIAGRPNGAKPYRKDSTAFSQLVLYIAGEAEDITNDDGNSSRAPWVMRLRAAIGRFIAGDLPRYNLYEPVVPPDSNEGGSMPYHSGKRVTTEEFIRLNGHGTTQLHTGPDGDNPAEAPTVDAETGAPKVKKGRQAGGNRSQRSEKAAKAAVADALGVDVTSPELADIDVSGEAESSDGAAEAPDLDLGDLDA